MRRAPRPAKARAPSRGGIGVATLLSPAVQGEAICRALNQLGFHVHECRSGDEMFDLVGSETCRLVLLDFAWRDQIDALSIAARLRAACAAGIVVLTGQPPIERVRSLQCGADACVGAPQDIEEIAAQLHALSRRIGQPAPCGDGPPEGAVEFPMAWQLINHGWTLVAPSGRALDLTSAERLLLRSLAATPDRVVGRQEWAEEDASGRSTRWLDVMVSRLRRKAQTQSMPLPIRVVRGKGYVFAEPLVIA